MSWSRAALMLGLAALSAPQAGCVIVDPCRYRNGNHGVLEFGPTGSPARGLQTSVGLTRKSTLMVEAPFYFPTRDPSKCLDFDGAEVQVTLPASFQGEVATVERLPGKDPVIWFRCSAPEEKPQQVSVRVVAGEVVRYEDSFDVTCHAVAKATAKLTANARPLTGNGYVVGGRIYVSLVAMDASGSRLDGAGAVPGDSLLVAEPEISRWWRDREAFRVAAPGQLPVLRVGSYRLVLPVTLVDKGGWSLELEASSNANEVLAFSAWAVTPAGDKLDGMEEGCRWTVYTAAHRHVAPGSSCDLSMLSTVPDDDHRPITRVCVEYEGQSACAPVPPR